jgi:multiple sugar transport system permease protein
MTATRSRRARRIGKSVFLAAASLLMIAPFLWALSTSFKLPGDVFAYPPRFLPDPATLANFQNVVIKIPFPRYLLNSTIVTGTIVVLNVIFGTAAAYAFAKLRFPGRDAIFFLLLLTLMVPFQVNLIPLYKMMVELHRMIPPLGADTYFGLIAPSAVSVFGIFLMRGFLRSIPDEILESARMDGASEWRVLRSIVFPLAVPGMATLAIFTFLAAWNDFLWPLVVTSSDDMRTLPVGLALLARRNASDWGTTMAGTVITAAPMILIFLLLQRRFIEGLTTGAVKDVG